MATDTVRDEIVTELLEKAELQGYLTTDDVLETLPGSRRLGRAARRSASAASRSRH